MDELQLSLFSNAIAETVQDNDAGVVFTPIDKAKNLIAPTIRLLSKQKSKLRILEPASGHGSLIFATIFALEEAGYKPSDVEFISNELNVHFLKQQKATLKKILPKWYSRTKFSCSDFLFKFQDEGKFDLVIMNPPWVGYKLIEPNLRGRIKSTFNLNGQFDLLDPFVLKANNLLNRENGRLALFLPDKVLSSHQPSNSIDLISFETARSRTVELPKSFFGGISHESIFIELSASKRKPRLEAENSKNTTLVIDLFNIFRGIEISEDARILGRICSRGRWFSMRSVPRIASLI